MNKLNTFVLQALDSPDIILYRSKHISAVSNPAIFDREETALQYYRIIVLVRFVLKWRHPQLFRALNAALTKS